MKNAGNDVHIVFAVDKNYAPFVIPVMHQLHKFDTKCDSIQIVVAEDVENSSRDLLISKGKEFGFEVKVVETNILNKLREKKIVKDRTHVSYFTYVKLFLPELLPSLDQVLYLDVDILIREPINDLLNWKLKSPVGAVIELGRNGKMLFNSNRQHYFNAGVLRMSLHKCREIALMEKAEEILIEKGGSFEFQDQDVLNIILKNRIDPLPNTFNVFHDNISISPKLDILNNPAIVHFNGPDKPWKDEVKNNFAQEWRSHLVNSGGNLSVLGITSSPEKSRIDFAAIISEIRFSPLGTKLRQSLPYFIKKSINSIIYWLYKISRRNNQVFLDALFSDAHVTAIETGIEGPNELNEVALEEESKPLQDLPPLELDNSEKLVFIVSRARSGTNALQDVMSGFHSEIVLAEELFGIYWTKEISQILKPKYAWLEPFNWKEVNSARLMPPEKIVDQYNSFRDVIDSEALNILADLLESLSTQQKTLVIKIFPDQLSLQKFHEILEIYRPKIIVLKRRMIFSYISHLKAVVHHHFYGQDNSDVDISFNENEIESYIANSDAWFNNIKNVARQLKLKSVDITYEGLFETGKDISVIERFMNESVETNPSDSTERKKTAIQDRRHDNFLVDVIDQYLLLPAKLQMDLLRYPGNNQ